jgi:hypothetical protein
MHGWLRFTYVSVVAAGQVAQRLEFGERLCETALEGARRRTASVMAVAEHTSVLTLARAHYLRCTGCAAPCHHRPDHPVTRRYTDRQMIHI